MERIKAIGRKKKKKSKETYAIQEDLHQRIVIEDFRQKDDYKNSVQSEMNLGGLGLYVLSLVSGLSTENRHLIM